MNLQQLISVQSEPSQYVTGMDMEYRIWSLKMNQIRKENNNIVSGRRYSPCLILL